MDSITRVDAGELEALATGPRALLIEFAADWCAPCRRLEPVLAQLATEFGDRLHVVQVDADEAPDAVDLYGADGLPSLVLVRNGTITGRLTGWHEPDVLRHEITMLLDVESGVAPRRGGAPGERGARPELVSARGARRLRFPGAEVGTLRIQDNGATTRVPAAGSVDVPPAAVVALRVGDPDARSDLGFLNDLPADGLDQLTLDGTFADDDLAPLAALSGLSSMLLAADGVSGSGLRHLAGSALQTLLLSCPQLDDDGMSQLPALASLRVLAVHGAEGLGDRGIGAIGRSSGLTSLDVCAHRVTDAGIGTLLGALADLEGLTLCIPDVTDAGLGRLSALDRLRSLGLETPLIGQGTLREMTSLPELRSLALYNCSGLTAADLAELTAVTKLRIENDDRDLDEVALLRLRLALPNCEINGSWYAAGAVAQRLAELTEAAR